MSNRVKIILLLVVLIFPCSARAETQRVVKVGAAMALTGWAAIGGTAEATAIKIAIEELNKQERAGGYKFDLVLEDTRSDFRQTAAAIQKLIHVDKVKFILGPNWTEFSEVVAPICETNKVIMLTVSGYTRTLTQGRNYVFTTLPSHAVMTAPMSKVILGAKHKKLGMITSETAYFESLSAAIREQILGGGVTLKKDDKSIPGETDFRSYITKLKSDGIDAMVLMLNEGGSLAAFIRQAGELNFSAKLYASNAVLFDSVITKEPQLAEGITFFNLLTLATPEFLKRFESIFGSPASDSVPRAHDAVYILSDVLNRCGDVDTATLANCLLQTDLTLQSGHITFNKDNTVHPDGVVGAAFIRNARGDQRIDQ